MEARFDNLEYKNIDHLVAGFITGEKKDKNKFHLIASPGLTYAAGMQIIQSMTTHFLTAILKQHPDMKDDIYDSYNFMASSILNNLVPDYQLRRDMDEEAIMETEKKMIEEEFAKMTPEQKAKALDDIEKMKAELLKVKDAKPTDEDNS